VWFSSREVQSVYEQEFKEPISLSTVATYLSRMTEKGFLMKVGSSRSLKYKLAAGSSQATVKQQIL
jgi:predicted transcriptional regulator